MNYHSLIQGIGLTGGFGCGTPALLAALARRETSPQWVDVETAGGLVSMPVLLADTSALGAWLSKAALRRLNHYSRMALLAAFAALDDAGALHTRPQRLGLIVCTGYGATVNTSLARHAPDGITDIFGSPTKFASSVHNAAAGLMAMALKETGPNLTVSQYDMSVPQGLLSAQLWLAEGRVDAVLVGGVDGCSHDLAAYRHSLIEGPKTQGNVLDTHSGPGLKTNNGGAPAIAGEGAVFLLLRPANSPPGGYACIESLKMERQRQSFSPPAFQPSTSAAPGVMIIGADGSSDNAQPYGAMVDGAVHVANYSAIYGALPVGMLFDVAIAALALRHDVLYPSGLPLPPVCYTEGLVHRMDCETSRPLNTDRIRCLKLGAGDMVAWVDVGKC